ncbi:MAG TPA: ABC transporter permease [Thermomicrobiaceae bacterium]|nr:ABC transporter permease [Thermomicrobiaceae bacterium]
MQDRIIEALYWPPAPPQPVPRYPRRRDQASFMDICLASAWCYMQRTLSSLIDLVRWPLMPAVIFLTMLLTYQISGRSTVDGYEVAGYLLVGTFGLVLWSSNLWGSGYAIEYERSEGTLTALFLTPASRAAVVLGYALGSSALYVLPSVLVVGLLAWVSGARLDLAHPLAAVVAALALVGASFALGYALAGFFVLTRRANLLANSLQSPIYLLSGMLVPVAALPGPLRPLASVFPISDGMTALRAALLGGAGLGDVGGSLLRLLLMSAILVLAGTLLLGRVEHDAKRGATLDYD